MEFVYKKNRWLSFFSVTSILIALNVILFFAFAIVSFIFPGFMDYIAVNPSSIVQGKSLWTLFTSMFMHANFFHLFVNMFSLFFLGRFAERLMGKKRFIWLYIISGIVGAVAFVLFAYFGEGFALGENLFGGMNDSAVGASGALFGLIGLLALIIPFHSVYLIVGPLILLVLQIVLEPLFANSPFGAMISVTVNVVIFVMIFAMFSSNPRIRKISVPVRMPLWFAPIAAIVPLVLVSLFVKLPIGNSAHVGGLIVGMIYGLYLRRKYKKKVMIIQRVFR